MTAKSKGRQSRSTPRPHVPVNHPLVEGDESAGPHDSVAHARMLLSTRISELRRARNFSTAELANLTGITPAMASQIERGVTNPSMSTLVRLAEALQVSVAQLFEVEHPDGMVVTRAQRRVISYPNLDVCDQIISSDPTRRLQVLESRIGPGQDGGAELAAHGADVEFVLILEGTVDILVGEKTFTLSEGDTLTFQGRLPHGFANTSTSDVRLIWVMTPAFF